MSGQAARFVDDPLASGSEQFGLSRPPNVRPGAAVPSAVGMRPWGLRAMRAGVPKGRPTPVFGYSHEQQLAVGEDGRPLIGTRMADPSADSVSDNDGDEGRSEDWKYDFVPDYPSQP